MEVQKITIRRSAPLTGNTWSLPCTGGTDYYPINLSFNCSGKTMYNSTGSQVMNALDSCVMSAFPEELRDCSPTNPCIILWDDPLGVLSTTCTSTTGHPYVIFKGLIYDNNPTFTTGSYNELITIYDITQTDINICLHAQGVTGHWEVLPELCVCDNPLDEILYKIPVTLTQDFNDIGHYSVWDGLIDQQQVFSNFVFTANTTGNGYKIQITNTTPFGNYKSLKESSYTINWGECPCGGVNTVVPFYPCCETLSYPTLMSVYEYANSPSYHQITITHDAPWGPTSVSHFIHVPNLTYNQILAQPFVATPAPNPGTGMGGAALGAGAALSPLTPGGNPYQVNIDGNLTVNPFPSVFLPPLFTSTAYHGTYGTIGTPNYYPLDSGTHINQYTGTTPFPCFEVTGITESLLGAFQTYTTSNSPNLLPGYTLTTVVPIGGDVVDPITNTITPGMVGTITWADTQYTGYTISSANGNTPIQFYDFPNGITIFVATSCGLNSLAFGGEDCFECPENFCDACLVVDEYIDRVTLLPHTIIPIPPAPSIQPMWSAFVDYVIGDIVYDVSPHDCCCYIAVVDITQVGSSPTPFIAGIKPSQLYQGVWVNPTGTNVHVWEGCTPDCVSCPTGSALPCQDPYNPFNAYPTMGPPGPAGMWANGQTFNTGDFIFGQDGNCYRALQNVPSGIVPTASTNNTYWDYIGCASWLCPQDLTNVGSDICELISGSTLDSFMFYAGPGGCVTAYNDGECPVEDRWHCTNPYGCEIPGCDSIDYTHDEYNNIGYPFAVTFSSMTDCEEWCNPIAWSCTTPSQTPCCEEISCAVMNQVDYYDIMTTYILPTPVMPFPGPPNTLLTATNNLLFLHPDYTQSNCELGVGGYTGCCDFTGWGYICNSGCTQFVGGAYPTESACNNAPLNNNGLPGPCGWECYDPWYTPCSGGTGVMGSSACIPCYTPGCGTSATSGECCDNCQPDPYDCWMCLSGSSNPCQSQNPCTTPIPSWYSQWTIDPALVPLSGYGPNDINFPTSVYPTMGPTYLTAQLCDDNCITSGGSDCLVNFFPPYGNYSVYGGCQNWPNAASLPSGWGWSPGGPYANYQECCDVTGCCDIMCDEDSQIFNPGSTQYNPAYPYWPCVYVAIVGANPPPSPTGPVFQTFAQCVSFNSSGCDLGVTCECACEDLLNGAIPPANPPYPAGNDSEFEPTGINYDQYEVVSWQLGIAHTCCYMCDCVIGSNTTTGPPAYARDCNYFTPGEGPDIDGLPNCWVSCEKTPSGDSTNWPQYNCDPCTYATGDTYSCYYGSPGDPIGCQFNSIPCVYPGIALQTAQNCYTASTCENECYAGCYCDDQGTTTIVDDFTACVMLQDVLNGTTTWTSLSYFYPSTFLCDQAILLPPPINLDCCDPQLSKWWCDDSEPCSSLNPCVPPDGCGCVEIFPGHPAYAGAWPDLSTCQNNCLWACEPGVNGSACQFVANNPLGYSPIHSSAWDCWQNETSPSHCYCFGVSTAWFCDTNPAQSASTSNCFSQTTIDSWVSVPPFPSWTPSLVYGQQGTTMPYPMSPTPFASQTDCQQACRFCCDPAVTCTCDLVPYDFNCHIAIGDCITYNQGQTLGYPCCPTSTWYCCHETDGCISYASVTGLPMPVGCLGLNGPFTDPALCQDHCHFLCGECGVDLGAALQPDPCHCDVFNMSIVGFSCPIVYNTMALCETSQYFTLASTGPSCCPCHMCLYNGSVTFPIVQSDVWSLVTVAVTPPSSGNILQADPYDINVTYSQGDVAIDDGCCWVMVLPPGNYPTPPPTNTTPIQFYNVYANALMVSTSPHTVDRAVWIPCDINCPNTASTVMYECVSGATSNSCDGSVVYLTQANYPSVPWTGIAPNMSDVMIYLQDAANGFQSTPFSGIRVVLYGAIGACWPIGPMSMWFMVDLVLIGCMDDPAIDAILTSSPITTTSMADFVNQITLLGIPGVTLSNTHMQNNLAYQTHCGESNNESQSVAHPMGGYAYYNSHVCWCTQAACTCQYCNSGPNCVYTTLTGPTGCNAAANANPCCVLPPVTGFWYCDTGSPNPGTGICPCIYDAAATSGYIDIHACTGDTTCCFMPPPLPWKCIDTSGTTQTLAQSSCGQNKIYLGGYVSFTQAFNGLTTLLGANAATYYDLFEDYYWSDLNNTCPSPCPPSPGYQYTMCADSQGYCAVHPTYCDINNGGSSLYNAPNFYSWGDMIDHINTVNANQGWGLLSNYNDAVATCYVKMGINEGTSWGSGSFWWTDGVEHCRCYCQCHCIEDASGIWGTKVECQLATNCCSASTGTLDGWECINLGAPCVPVYAPNIAQYSIANYGSSSAAQTACDLFCVQIWPIPDCDDCDTTLGPGGTNQLTMIPSNQMGAWQNNVTYDINDCVYDTSTANQSIIFGCCYCCVPFIPGQFAGACDVGFTPSLNVNINSGGGQWVACGYDADGNPTQSCVPIVSNACTSCSIDLVNLQYLPQGTNVTFPYQPPWWGAIMGFQMGECIYDVDPLQAGEECCWCCACPGGYSQLDGICLPLGPAMQGPNTTSLQGMGGLPLSGPVTPSPCEIDQFGGFSPPLPGSWTGWVPCGYDSTGLNCSASPNIQNN
tara:strand:- start:30588 stop:38351 length:7764 start_codon:yes stop_codon:yes gene_type:complete